MNQFRFPVRKCGKRGLWTSHMSSSRKKMSGWGWERHGQSHPITHVEKLWQPGLRLVNPNATGRVKLHRDLSKWQCTPSNVLPWSFKITIVLKQFVITEAFYLHLMPWNLPNSEFHGIQILGFPFFVDAIQAPYSFCRLQIPGTKCPMRFLTIPLPDVI